MGALFFSQRKPRGFNYQPRFYDPEAEAREERKKVVLGEKYRSPAQRARDRAAQSTDEQATGGATITDPDYVPGTFLREHIAARRGNAHAAEAMRRRRKKTHSVPVLVGALVIIALVIWMLYFK